MEPGTFQLTQKVFLRHGSQLLVMRDANTGHGDLPGGRAAASELFELAASLRRELEEELGEDLRYELEPRPVMVFPTTSADGKIGVVGVGYEARYLGGALRLSTEHDWMAWVDVAAYDPSPLFEASGLLEAMEQYLETARRAR